MILQETDVADDQDTPSATITDADRFNFYIRPFPPYNFRKLPLEKPGREQCARRYEPVANGSAKGKSVLQARILDDRYNARLGTYVPTAFDVYLRRKLPDTSLVLPSSARLPGALPTPFFTNGLRIPENYNEPGFNWRSASAPSDRLSNIGWFAVTLEYDPKLLAQFEVMLGWHRGESCPFDAVDKKLSKLAEYRGYCIVFSGRRSIHHHLIISTEHLKCAPFDADAELRLQHSQQQSDILTAAYEIYWDHCKAVFDAQLKPPLEPDVRMRSPTQWRRMPWGIRTIQPEDIEDAEGNFLRFEVGEEVPQVVIRENIRSYAPRGNDGFLVPSTYSSVPKARPSRSKSSRAHVSIDSVDNDRLVALLQETCRDEFGQDYPLPVEVDVIDDEVIIYFRNHADDRNPSTVCIGDYRRLILLGTHSFGSTQFFLPESANALVEKLLARIQRPVRNDQIGGNRPATVLDHFAGRILRRFAEAQEPETQEPTERLEQLRQHYGQQLGSIIRQSRDFKKVLIVGPPGIRKTSTLLPLIQIEAQDDAYRRSDGMRLFAAVSVRSRLQCQKKAAEFRALGYQTKIYRTFSDYYAEACLEYRRQPIPITGFNDSNLTAILKEIREKQPEVFRHLEDKRKGLWGKPNDPEAPVYDPHSTLFVMTHGAMQTFDEGVNTRLLHNPMFDPDMPWGEAADLHKHVALGRVIVDDPEIDDFIKIFPQRIFDFIRSAQEDYVGWGERPHRERVGIYLRYKAEGELPEALKGYEDFDEAMRLPLQRFERFEVDFDRIPFGPGNSEKDIYRQRNGDVYYLAPKAWALNSNRPTTVCTTEQLVGDAWEAAARRGGRGAPLNLRLDHLPGMFPIDVDLRVDSRARKAKIKAEDNTERKEIDELANEILSRDGNAIVIGNMIQKGDRVLTIQGMKGLNGLESKNIYIILTHLGPSEYARRNVIGQYLGNDDVILQHYQDSIDQAVGRNRGFRHRPNQQTGCEVIASSRLARNVLADLWKLNARVNLVRLPT